MMIFFIFENFSKNRKNWSFCPPWPWGPFSLISHMSTEFIQMSEFLYFSCPDVILWWFSSFSKLFEKSKKLKFLPTPSLGTFFAHFTHEHRIHPMSEVLYFSCPDVRLWWFSSFSKTFRKIEKIEVFAHSGSGDLFRSFHAWAQNSSKWVNFYILVVLLMSDYDAFLHFRELFEKSKKLKFLPSPALETFLCLHNFWLTVPSWTMVSWHFNWHYNRICRCIECRYKAGCLYIHVIIRMCGFACLAGCLLFGYTRRHIFSRLGKLYSKQPHVWHQCKRVCSLNLTLSTLSFLNRLSLSASHLDVHCLIWIYTVCISIILGLQGWKGL